MHTTESLNATSSQREGTSVHPQLTQFQHFFAASLLAMGTIAAGNPGNSEAGEEGYNNSNTINPPMMGNPDPW